MRKKGGSLTKRSRINKYVSCDKERKLSTTSMLSNSKENKPDKN
jgi:hypothetical protein